MKLVLFVMLPTLYFQILAGLALGAPLPLEMIANDTTRECAQFLPGDECVDCTIPSGWRNLGRDASCPAGYTIVSVEGICRGFEIERCCTEGHSGAAGNCENMTKNDLIDECAFMEDPTNCTLPVGWSTKPKNVSSSEWACPAAYDWTAVRCNTPS